jgi:hypothetical protein
MNELNIRASKAMEKIAVRVAFNPNEASHDTFTDTWTSKQSKAAP